MAAACSTPSFHCVCDEGFFGTISFMQWRTSVAVLVAVGIVSSLAPAYAATPPFPDMTGSWYKYQEAVAYLTERGIIGGYPDGSFKPNDPINRAEFLKLVFKGHNTVSPDRRCFSDVPVDAWYAPYVCTAKRRGIVNGYPNGTYQAERTINVAEAIKIALGAYGREIEDGSGDDWFRPYVNYLDREEILPSHSYIPWDTLTRERAADLIWRLVRFDDEQILARYSAGCGKGKPAAPSSVMVDGIERSFLLNLPSHYVVHDPAPLIVAFHGRTNSNEQVRSYYRLDREISQAFIVYPAALSNGNGSFSWSDPGDRPEELRDIAFFDAIVKKLAGIYCIDLDRIFVVGHSLGAWFANSVACVRGDVVRASATVGGSSVITDCAGPAAALIAHNPNDRLSPFSGSEINRQQRVEENSCTWSIEASYGELNCSKHLSCQGGNDVVWCPHTHDEDYRGEYYPHNWPPNTERVIHDFFEKMK